MTEEPSVVFLIPFGSRQVRANWSTACEYLQQTSVRYETRPFTITESSLLVMKSRKLKKHSIAKFIFCRNNQFLLHLDVRAAQRSDKLAKIGAGWTHAKSKWQPEYVMKLDADDFISSRLVGWLDANGTEAGYLIRYGWLRDHHVAAQR